MHQSNNKKAIVVPCYNESQRLPQDAFLFFAENNQDIDIWLVNDGSKDNTYEILQDLASRQSNIFATTMPQNSGKAETIRHTFMDLAENAQYHYLAYLDADLAAPLEETLPLFDIIERQKLLLVAGSRIKMLGTTIIRSSMRHYFSRIFATYYSELLRLRNYDTQCGLKVVETGFVKKIFNKPFMSRWFFDIEMFVRAYQQFPNDPKLSMVKEVPLNEWKEVGDSRLKLKDFINAPIEILKIYKAYKK